MSTATLAAPPRRPAAEPHPLAGTGTLIRFGLRRDRVRLAMWLIGVGAFTAYVVVALDSTYPTAADRQARAAVMSSPAAAMLSGPGYGSEHYTLGAMVANELGLSVLAAVAIMSISLMVRHTRAEEESGRAELVRAGVVGRRAPLSAALGLVGAANVGIAAVMTAALAGTGLAVADAVAFAAGVALTGVVFGSVAALTAEASASARTASGAALAALGAAAVVRGVGDVLRPRGSALSWFSPIAWAQQTRAFVELRWWPLLLSAGLAAVLLGIGYRLVELRDTGSGLWPQRPGPATASPMLAGPVGLVVRLQRTAILGWAVSLALFGVAFGSLTNSVTDLIASNARLASMVATFGTRSLIDGYFAVAMLYLGFGVAAFAGSSVLRVRGEEAAGRAELLLATPLARRRYFGGGLVVSVAAAVLLLTAMGLATGLAAATVSGDWGLVGRLVQAALVLLPAVLVVAGVAAALVGLAPRLSALTWVLVGESVLVGLFGRVLAVPTWVLKLSPFGWLPAAPAERITLAPLLGLTLVAAALFAAGLAGFRRRDVTG